MSLLTNTNGQNYTDQNGYLLEYKSFNEQVISRGLIRDYGDAGYVLVDGLIKTVKDATGNEDLTQNTVSARPSLLNDGTMLFGNNTSSFLQGTKSNNFKTIQILVSVGNIGTDYCIAGTPNMNIYQSSSTMVYNNSVYEVAAYVNEIKKIASTSGRFQIATTDTNWRVLTIITDNPATSTIIIGASYYSLGFVKLKRVLAYDRALSADEINYNAAALRTKNKF